MKKILPHKFLIFLLSLVFLLRLPSLFEPYWYGDEGIYLTLGNALRQGLVFYRDIHDNKPPLLYLFAAVSGSLFWFRFLLLAWSMATIFFFYKLAQIFTTSKLAKAAAVLMAVLSTIPLLEGNIANAEIFMLLPTIVGVYLIFKQDKSTPGVLFSAGLLFSLATLFKIPAAFDFAALLIFLVFFQSRKLLFTIYSLLFTILGFSLPILTTLFYYWSQGALGQYFTAAFAQNLPYLSSWQTGQSAAGSSTLMRGLLLLILLAFVWGLRKKWTEKFSFVLVWFLFSLFAATLSGRPYPHYLIQVLPALILLFSFLPNLKVLPRLAIVGLLGLFLFSTFYFRFWSYPTLSYYQNFLLFVLGQRDKDSYFSGLNPKVPQTYKLAEFLNTHTNPEERIFAWGDSPNVYALSRRLPAGRYTASYHIVDFNGYEGTIQALKKSQPRFVIDLRDESRPFPQLQAHLAENYTLFEQTDNALIYRLLPLK